MINCSKIRFSLFGSRRDDSKTEDCHMALAYNGRKTKDKKQTQQNI